MKRNDGLARTRRKNAMLMSIPWVIGLFVFFAVPLFNTVMSSFGKLSVGTGGEQVFDFIGTKNYTDLFTTITSKNGSLLVQIFTEENIRIFTNTPVLMIFSLFAAILINKEFKGRTLARLVFFLPIILGLDIVQTLMSTSIEGNYMDVSVQSMFSAKDGVLSFICENIFLPDAVMDFMASLNENIYTIVSGCGVQILIFLAGLQSISPALYEVAKIEGAGSYVIFWKITLPMLSNILVFVLVYSFVDLFLASSIADEIFYLAFTQNNIGAGSALSIVYMVNVVIDMGLLLFVLKKVVSITNENV